MPGAPRTQPTLTARVASRVSREALRRGVRTGSRTWFYVFAAAQGVRLLQRVVSPRPEVFRLKLRPGEAIEIREVKRSKPGK
jgi:hypothetical protein